MASLATAVLVYALVGASAQAGESAASQPAQGASQADAAEGPGESAQEPDPAAQEPDPAAQASEPSPQGDEGTGEATAGVAETGQAASQPEAETALDEEPAAVEAAESEQAPALDDSAPPTGEAPSVATPPSVQTPDQIDAELDEVPAPPGQTSTPDCPPMNSPRPCQVGEKAEPLIFGGLGTGGLGLLGALGFALAASAERAEAQSLLESSPAFDEVGDRYIIRSAGHADVVAYEEHRATASTMTQLVWISLGVAVAGATTAGTAFFLSSEAEDCRAEQ